MADIIKKVEKDYQFNPNDTVILAYIVEHLDEVVHLSSHQLAKLTYSSPTAVIRFVKKLGFVNYNDFKLNIRTFLNKYYLEEMSILVKESHYAIQQKLAEIEKSVIDQTKDHLDAHILNQAMDLIIKNKYIDIIANDANACIGQYASHLFLSTGKIVTVYQNSDKQLRLSLNADETHTVILISKHGKNKHLLKVADLLIQRHIPLIVITSQEDSALSHKKAIFLYGEVHTSFGNLKDMVFYISLKYIFDLIYTILVSIDLKSLKELDDLYGYLYYKGLKDEDFEKTQERDDYL